MVRFDDDVDRYCDDVQASISFSGQEVAFFHERKAEALVDLTTRLVGDPRRLRVLDVGCGVGSIDRFLEGRFEHLCGVDAARDALGKAAVDNKHVRYVGADGVGGLPFATATFDVVFAICVIHHVEPPDRIDFVTELRRVVRTGGLVVVFEHNALNPLTRLAVSRCDLDVGVELLTRWGSIRLAEAGGLVPVEARDIIFTTFDRPWARRLDRVMGRLPLGAQHYVAARHWSGSGS